LWRLLPTESDKLVIETRNMDKREAEFHCIDAYSGKKIFKNLQLNEKFWVGIEKVHKDIILFHKFKQPNMPAHKGVIAYDINKKEKLWENMDYSFLFVFDESIYCYKQKFEGREFFKLDLNNGKLVEELGSDVEKINDLRNDANLREDFSKFKFPESLHDESEIDGKSKEVISHKTDDLITEGFIEYAVLDNLLCFNYHSKENKDNLRNHFIAYDTASNKELISETLNKDLNAFVPDSFFIKKDLLFLIKGKDTLEVYKINT
jgi:hypothetical protein